MKVMLKSFTHPNVILEHTHLIFEMSNEEEELLRWFIS